MDTEYLTAEEVGQILGCQRRRVCTLARQGRLKGIRLLGLGTGKGKSWAFLPADVNAHQRLERYGQRLVKTMAITATRDDLIWFAGFFDGEGCVSLQKRKEGGCWHLSLLVPNTARSLMAGLPALFGGSVFHMNTLPHQGQPQMRWRASGRQAGLILRALLPYLRVKHRQARLGIEFQNRVDEASNNGHRPVSGEDREWRDAACLQMKWLNHHYE